MFGNKKPPSRFQRFNNRKHSPKGYDISGSVGLFLSHLLLGFSQRINPHITRLKLPDSSNAFLRWLFGSRLLIYSFISQCIAS